MIITFIIVGGTVVVAFGIINCVHSLIRYDTIARGEREAAAEERREAYRARKSE